MLSGCCYPWERGWKSPCLKYLATQTSHSAAHKILPHLLKPYCTDGSLLQDIRVRQCGTPLMSGNTLLIPPRRWGSRARKAAGPGAVLEGCESVAVLLLTQLPPPSFGCTPAAHRTLMSAWLLSDRLQRVASAPRPWAPHSSPWQQLAVGIGYGIWTLCCTQIWQRFICKNRAGIFQHWHQLPTGFRKRDFSHLHVIKPY